MVLGYDQRRPTAGNYEEFLRRFIEGLERSGISDLSFMVYGSYARGDYVPGRSDIDAVLTFGDNVIINKENLNIVSLALRDALKGRNVPFQVTPTDLITMVDGRFNSYDPSFRDYFTDEGRIVFGPDYREKFTYELSKHPQQERIVFGLRKVRQGLLFAELDRVVDYNLFLTRFNRALDVISSSPKQVLLMVDGRLRKNRFSALEEITSVFPSLNLEPLERIRYLYKNLGELDKLYRDPDELLKVWNSSVTFFEEVILNYLISFPR